MKSRGWSQSDYEPSAWGPCLLDRAFLKKSSFRRFIGDEMEEEKLVAIVEASFGEFSAKDVVPVVKVTTKPIEIPLSLSLCLAFAFGACSTLWIQGPWYGPPNICSLCLSVFSLHFILMRIPHIWFAVGSGFEYGIIFVDSHSGEESWTHRVQMLCSTAKTIDASEICIGWLHCQSASRLSCAFSLISSSFFIRFLSVTKRIKKVALWSLSCVLLHLHWISLCSKAN